MPKRDAAVAEKKSAKAANKKESPKAGEKVKVNVTEKRLKTYLGKLGFLDNVFDLKTNRVNSDGISRDVSFVTFSENGVDDAEMSDEFNEGVIKDILFDYHTDNKDKTPFSLDVIAATEESPAVLAYQIYSAK